MRGPDPLPGSILPGKRIVAFYGNPLSKRMGILGEIPYDQMLAKLDTVVGEWRAADPVDTGAAGAAPHRVGGAGCSPERTACTASDPTPT